MRITSRVSSLLILVVLWSGSVFAQQKTPQDLLGSYLFRFEWGGVRIELKSDGTFTSQASSCTSVTTESGPYSVSQDVITFTGEKLTSRNYGDHEKEIDLRKRKARKKILGTDEPFKVEQSELRVVRWGERIYLMNVRGFEQFIDAINLGFEPRQVDGYRAMYGEFLLREGDENKQVTGAPALPVEFLSMILSAPVITTVVKVETIDNKTIATLDRGSSDGLRKDMTLVPVSNDAFFFRGFWLLSVDQQSAKLYVGDEVKVGYQFTTRVEGVSRYAWLSPRALHLRLTD
jgi:hypothetical protein